MVREDLRLLAEHLPEGSPQGLRLIHLQCHIGLDTLSWARLGATVTGVDFSEASITAAGRLARRAQLGANFVASDIGSVTDVVHEKFDVVYTGIGVLPWSPRLDSWAKAIYELLLPGGSFL